MAKKKISTLEKIEQLLFDPEAKPELIKLSPVEEEIRVRYAAIFSVWLDNPYKTDQQMVKFATQQYKIGKSQAYNDIAAVKYLLGNVRNANKEWARYTVIEMLKEAYQVARKSKDAKGMAMAAAALGKYTKCDQEDLELLPWDEITPPNLEPTNDVSVIDPTLFRPDIEEYRKKIRAKYKDAVDVDYTPVNEEQSK